MNATTTTTTPIQVGNLFEVIRPVGGGLLARMAGVGESPVIFIPVVVTGWAASDAARMSGTPSIGRFVRVNALKGHRENSHEVIIVATPKGWRLEGWGGLRITANAQNASSEALEKNAAALTAWGRWEPKNTPAALRAAGLTTAAALVEGRIAENAAREAAAAAKEAAEIAAKEAAEIAARDAAERAKLEAAAAAAALEAAELAADTAAATALGVGLADFRSMPEKARRLAAHRARLAGKM